MDLRKYAAPLVAALFLAAAPASAQQDAAATQTPKPRSRSFEHGQKMIYNQMSPGYNATARVEVRGAWDLCATASFLYWQFFQDNMDVAFAATTPNSQYTAIAGPQIQGHYVPMDFGYVPGFQVGLGVNFDLDNWDSFAEYTRIHGSNSASTNGQADSAGNPFPILPTWGNAAIVGSNAYNNVSEHWDCHLDVADIDLGRTYYVGTCWTVRPSFGARATWILQKLRVRQINTSFSNAVSPIEIPGEMNISHRNHSWSVGPQAKLNTNWALGSGFRFFGNAETDLLYTRYNIHSKTVFIATAAVPPMAAGDVGSFHSKNRFSALRPHMDMEMGFGWGSYFDNNNWHVDLTASYGFQVFFNQNMFPQSEQSNGPAKQQMAASNLYAQGATGTIRFDF